jgi:hypothetical protein
MYGYMHFKLTGGPAVISHLEMYLADQWNSQNRKYLENQESCKHAIHIYDNKKCR